MFSWDARKISSSSTNLSPFGSMKLLDGFEMADLNFSLVSCGLHVPNIIYFVLSLYHILIMNVIYIKQSQYLIMKNEMIHPNNIDIATMNVIYIKQYAILASCLCM